jgi:hypothetical protein
MREQDVELNVREANNVAEEKVREIFQHDGVRCVVLEVGRFHVDVGLHVPYEEGCRIDVNTLPCNGKRRSKS